MSIDMDLRARFGESIGYSDKFFHSIEDRALKTLAFEWLADNYFYFVEYISNTPFEPLHLLESTMRAAIEKEGTKIRSYYEDS